MGIEIGIGTAAKEKPLAVGIDLGTTNSLVAYVKDSRPVVIAGAEWKQPRSFRCFLSCRTICLSAQRPEIPADRCKTNRVLRQTADGKRNRGCSRRT